MNNLNPPHVCTLPPLPQSPSINPSRALSITMEGPPIGYTLDLLAFYKMSYALLMLKTCFSIFIKIYGTISSYSYIT